MRRTGLSLGVFLTIIILSGCATRVVPVEKPLAQDRLFQQTKVAGREPWVVEWEELQIKAKQEGKVFVGSSAGGARDALSGPLKKKFGLDLEWLASASGALIARINTERKAGLYLFDILITGPDTPDASLRPSGAIVPLEDWLLLPEVKDTKVWYGGKPIFYDEEHTLLAMTATPTGDLTINTTRVSPAEIKSLRDLLDPKWKGKIVMHSPIGGGSGRRWSTFIVDLLGYDFLKQLVNQSPVLTDNHRLAAEWVARGKYSIGIAIRFEDVISFVEAGAPLARIYTSEGGYLSASGGYIMILDKAPHPKATRLFVNWLLSREGQILWSKGSTDHTARTDVKIEELEIHPLKIRQPGVKYHNTLSRAQSSVRYEKEIAEIFSSLLR